MKPVIIGGCPKCGGTMGQEDYFREPNGKYTIEFACTQCGKREYREVDSLEQVNRRVY